MNIKRKNALPDDPGGTGSMQDLSFLLIIFFIVIASFAINKGFILNLPDKNTPKIVLSQDLIRCTLTANGEFFMDGTQISYEELEDVLSEKKSKYPNMTFLLEVDPHTEYQSFVNVIDKIRRLGIENFSFRMNNLGE